MIDFRLDKAHTEPGPPPKLFSLPAVIAIFLLTRGYPRRIVMLCSKVIIGILVSRDQRAGVAHVLRAARETSFARSHGTPFSLRRVVTVTAAIITAAALIAFATQHAPEPIAKQILIQPAKIEQPPAEETPPIMDLLASNEQPAALPAKEAPPLLAPSPSAQHSPEQPAILGTLHIEHGVNLSKTIARVYGRYSPRKLRLILEANPQITDPDHIAPLTTISFPALPPSEAQSIQTDRTYLELARSGSLAEAYAIVKDSPDNSPPLLIAPVKTEDNSFRFHVILEENFTDAQSAQAKATALPLQWQSMVKTTKGKELLP